MVRNARNNSGGLHKKTPVEMRGPGPGTSKHCVTNMAADEKAAVIAAIFLVNKQEKENRETVLDLPNVLAVLYTKERSHIPRITGYADNVVPAYEKSSYFW